MDTNKLNSNSDKLYRFLRKWAFNVDRERFDMVLQRMRDEATNNHGEQRKQGWFFKTLLFKLDRFIDWNIAREMEADFEKK